MGCTTSKLDDLPAVALCRERCSYLNDAIRQRYALAEAHVAYIHSLKEIGFSLDRFFDTDLDGSASPVLPLPPHRKGDLDSVPVVAAVSAASASATAALSSPPRHSSHSNSNSNSGSHLHFHSSDEEDDDDDGSLHHSGNLSPFHHYDGGHEALGGGGGGGDIFGGGGFGDGGFGGGGFGGGGFSGREFGGRGGGGFGGGEFGGGGMHMNYMRKGPTQSVVHEQRPMSPETVQHMSGSSYFNYQNHENPNPYPYYNYPPSYSNYGFSGSSPPQYGSSYYPPQQHPANNSAAAAATSSKPPPPPPSPPRGSPWDFLNPFDTIEKYYQANTPSRDSREVREEEGIPDLEDENYQDEVVKEVHGEQRFSDAGSRNHSKRPAVDEDHRRGEEEVIYEAGPSGSAESKGDEYEVHLVDKNVVANEERVEERSNVPSYKAQSGSAFRGASDVIKEIKSQFDRASESGIEVCRMLEVGKVPYPRKNAVYQVSSKMLHSITPSLSVVSSQTSTSKNAETSSSAGPGPGPVPVYLDVDGDITTRSGKLSSTLQKLYIWEKKLYDEVKAEEKMRIVHERKCRRLKRLDERGAEAPKIDATRTLIRSLSTKIRIAIQVVDKISVKINTLRDEELWPQINELISGFIIMWKVMLECHQNQCHAITEAKNLDAITSNRRSSTDNLAAAMQLEDELLNWISNFSSWVGAQRGYVRALNGWLTKCLLQEPPEETVDGPVPYSPGRYGAPPIFVICNQWSQAVERLSDKEVIDAMRIFTVSVHHLLEQHDTDLRHRTLTNKDMESQVKAFARDEQKMQKKWQTVDKKMVLVSGHGIGLPGQIIHQSDTSNLSSLQAGLKQIFEAMERFTANSMQAYEELRVRCEEQKASQENPRVS